MLALLRTCHCALVRNLRTFEKLCSSPVFLKEQHSAAHRANVKMFLCALCLRYCAPAIAHWCVICAPLRSSALAPCFSRSSIRLRTERMLRCFFAHYACVIAHLPLRIGA